MQDNPNEQGKPRFAADSPFFYRRPAPDLCVDFCEQHGITPKCHCLNYDQWTPMWVPQEVSAVKPLLDKRMREIAERYRNRIPGFEVINETLCGFVEESDRHSTMLFHDPEVVEWSFKTARRHFPMNELIINEATEHVWGDAHDYFKGNRNKYLEQCRLEIEHGAPIDAIGMQFHMFSRPETEVEQSRPYYDPRALYAVMDRYADFSLPFQITELTIPAHDEGAENEQIQAEIIRLLYSIWFSHPNMEAIMYWNLVDGYAAYAPQGDMTCGENQYRGGLVRFDFTPKPSYYMVRDLFRKVWHTEAAAVSREDGRARFKGFYGEYDLTIHAGEKTVTKRIHLTRNGTDTFKIEL